MRASKGERVRTRTVEAVKNLSLDIPHGSVVGIVGANGAGKSTLMRSIAGILPPTSGQITVNGRISTLLALGVGFNKALSGRDNIILGGLAAGMSKAEIESQTDSIAEFADLPEGFIDMPVRTYSNGMYSRVAFAVAVNMTPDILLLDEVSHALSSLNELCDRAIWLHKGKMLASGKPEEITEQYLKFLNVGELPSSYEDL